MKLPTAGDEPPPLVISPQQAPEPVILTAQEDPAPQGEVRKRRRRLSKDSESATPSWEHQRGKRSPRSEKILMISMVGGAALLVAAALIVFLKSKPVAAPPPPLAVAPVVVPPMVPPPVDEAPDVGAFLRQAEPLAKTFLEAKTVPELLAVVRHPKITGQRLKDRYPDGMLKPVGMSSFAEGGSVVLDKSTAVVKVRTGTFEERVVSFYHSSEGWKVDWESWVGWSDMPWDEFKEKQPQTPSRFRVHLKPIIYYNFGFSDDRKWRSYLAESPDGNHRFFAYVERGSRVDDLINLADTPGGGDYVLDLRFPPDNPGSNQVLIEDRVAEGWVEPEPTDPP